MKRHLVTVELKEKDVAIFLARRLQGDYGPVVYLDLDIEADEEAVDDDLLHAVKYVAQMISFAAARGQKSVEIPLDGLASKLISDALIQRGEH